MLLPPINGATAASGTPYFTENPGDPYQAWDMSGNIRLHAQPIHNFPLGIQLSRGHVPPFSGLAELRLREATRARFGSLVPGWPPDLRKNENRLNRAILVKF